MYTIAYHPQVREDIKKLSKDARRRIQKAIEEKVAKDPETFGKPLRYSLYGVRSLRVGEYRVGFFVRKNEVVILIIAHRSVIYKKLEERK